MDTQGRDIVSHDPLTDEQWRALLALAKDTLSTTRSTLSAKLAPQGALTAAPAVLLPATGSAFSAHAAA